MSASAPYIIFVLANRSATIFFLYFGRFSGASQWPDGTEFIAQIGRVCFFFSWLLLLQDGIYARYFTAGVLVDDIVDGFRFGADQEPRKMLSDLRPEFLQRPAS